MRFSIKLGNTEFWTEFSIGNEQDSYIVKVINMGLLTFIIILFFSDAIYPFSFFQFWHTSPENWLDWLKNSTFLFAWGCVLTIILSIVNYHEYKSFYSQRNQINI